MYPHDQTSEYREHGASPGELRAALAGMAILKGIARSTISALAEAAQRRDVDRSATIFERGSKPTGLFFVVEGGVKLVSLAPDNRARVVELFERGAMFGEIGVFSGAPYRTWTQAVTATTLIHVDRRRILAVLDADPRLATRMLAAVTARTQRLIDSISCNAVNTADARIAAYLLELAERSDAAEGPIVLPAPKGTIASLLNLSQESLSRALRRMADAGLLMVTGRRIRIHDRARLLELMDQGACASAAA